MKRSASVENLEEAKKAKVEDTTHHAYIMIQDDGGELSEYLVTRELTDFEREKLAAADGLYNCAENDVILRCAEGVCIDFDNDFDLVADADDEDRAAMGDSDIAEYELSRAIPKDKRGTLSAFKIREKNGVRPKISGKVEVFRFCMVD